MIKYILKRLFQSVIVILLVVCVVFFLLRMMPSDYFFTEDELMKFTEAQKYAKLERLGIMEICGECGGTGTVDGHACPRCLQHPQDAAGAGFVNRSVFAQLGDFFGDLIQFRVFNAKGKEIKTIDPISFFPYISQRIGGQAPFGELKEGYQVRPVFNLGKSIRLEKNQYVTDVILTKMTVSMEIGLISLAISLVLGVVFGVIQARFKNRMYKACSLRRLKRRLASPCSSASFRALIRQRLNSSRLLSQLEYPSPSRCLSPYLSLRLNQCLNLRPGRLLAPSQNLSLSLYASRSPNSLRRLFASRSPYLILHQFLRAMTLTIRFPTTRCPTIPFPMTRCPTMHMMGTTPMARTKRLPRRLVPML